jgi:hypothetical protein
MGNALHYATYRCLLHVTPVEREMMVELLKKVVIAWLGKFCASPLKPYTNTTSSLIVRLPETF